MFTVELTADVTPKHPEVVTFMRAVARNLETQGPTQTWSSLVESGALPAKSQRKFMKWWSGHNAPEHQQTIAMLTAAQMLIGYENGSTRFALLDKVRALIEQIVKTPNAVPASKRKAAAAGLQEAARELAVLAARLEGVEERGTQP